MKILIYGEGVIGSIFAAKLSFSGRDTPARIVNSYYAISGKYRVSTVAKVYSSSGTLVDAATAYSAERIYA